MKMNRKEALNKIITENKNSLFIYSNGLTSREALAFYNVKKSFYMLHAMGETLSVAIGLASARPEENIVVIEGDGNALMGCSSWSMNSFPNVKLYILDNGMYKTTGGQKIPTINAIEEYIKIIKIDDSDYLTPNPKEPSLILNEFLNDIK